MSDAVQKHIFFHMTLVVALAPTTTLATLHPAGFMISLILMLVNVR